MWRLWVGHFPVFWLNFVGAYSALVRWGLLDFLEECISSFCCFFFFFFFFFCFFCFFFFFFFFSSGQRRTSTESFRSQWAAPDLNRELQIAVGSAGPQRQLAAADRSGQRRTVGSARPQQGDAAKWATPDLNCQKESQKEMSGRAPDRMPERMTEDMPDRMSEDAPERMPEDVQKRKSEMCQKRMPEDMPERMSQTMSKDMPERMSEDMPERLWEDICQ